MHAVSCRIISIGLGGAVALASGGCHGPDREVGMLRTTAMLGTPLEKEGYRHGYEPEKAWKMADLNASQRLLYLRIQRYFQARGDVYDAAALKDGAEMGLTADGKSADPTMLRNELAAVLLTQAAWFQHGMEEDVYEAVGSTETSFDLVGLVLNAVGATTGAAADKSAYNAAAGAVLGFKSSLEKNFLSEQTQAAILHEMQALWLTHYAEILERLGKTKDSEYSLAEVAMQVKRMSGEAWLREAVVELARKAAEDAKTAKDSADSAAKGLGAGPGKKAVP